MTAPQNGASLVSVNRATTVQPSQIDQVISAVLECVGVTQRGPVDTLVECDSIATWKATFGDYTVNNLATVAAMEGWWAGAGDGARCLFVRTVHHTTPGDPTTKTSSGATLDLLTGPSSVTAGAVTGSGAVVAPFAITPGASLVVSVNGAANQTVTFGATAASRTSGNAAPFALANGDILTLAINGATAIQVTFNTSSFVSIGAATALEVAAVINARFASLGTPAVATVSAGAVVITTTQLGNGASVNISAGGAQASGKLNFTAGLLPGTGNVANSNSVQASEVIAAVNSALTSPAATATSVSGAIRISSNTTGGSSSIQVIAGSSTAAAALGLDTALHTGNSGAAVNRVLLTAQDGSYANGITPVVSAASSGDTTKQNVAFQLNGVTEETFANVSLDPNNPMYICSVVNGNSVLGLTVTDLGGSPTDTLAQGTFGPMTGGSDGLVGINDSDFAGGVSSNGKTGLRVLDGDGGAGTLLICPQQPTPVVHNAMLTYCSVTRNNLLFAILDPPAGMNVQQMIAYMTQTANLTRTTELAAMYWPRIQVATPNAALFGSANVTIAPSGDIAAAYAQNDALKPIGGAFEGPGGVDVGISRMLGIESTGTGVFDYSLRSMLTAVLVNPISKESGTDFFIDGVLTLLDTGNFPTIGQSRGIQIVSLSIVQGCAFARHKNNTPDRRGAVADLVTKFMTDVTNAGVLATTIAAQAFQVDVGAGLNTPAVQKTRTMRGRVGVATASPSDYIYFDIFPDLSYQNAQLAQAS